MTCVCVCFAVGIACWGARIRMDAKQYFLEPSAMSAVRLRARKTPATCENFM